MGLSVCVWLTTVLQHKVASFFSATFVCGARFVCLELISNTYSGRILHRELCARITRLLTHVLDSGCRFGTSEVAGGSWQGALSNWGNAWLACFSMVLTGYVWWRMCGVCVAMCACSHARRGNFWMVRVAILLSCVWRFVCELTACSVPICVWCVGQCMCMR